MIKSKKNLLCFFLALVALVFSAMFAVSISPKANAEVTSIKISGFNASNDNVILLDLSDPISVTGGESIKLLVNDKEVNTSVYGTADNGRSVYINLSKATYRPNDKYWNIRIPKGTVFGNYEVAEDYNLYNLYNANTGTYGIISQEDTTPLTIKGLNRVVPDHAGQNRWYISLNADAADVDNGAIWNCGIVYATDSNDVNGEYTVYGHGNTISVYKESNSSLGLIINYEVFGETQAATGSKRLVKIPKGTVWGGYVGKYRIAESFWLLYDGETFNYYNYDPTDKGITLDSASVKMGGDYSDVYYSFNGEWKGAGWFVNNVAATGNINVKYTIESETRTAGGVYGVARLINANASNKWAVSQGLIDFTQNGSAGTWKDVADSNEILLSYNSATHRRTLNNSIIWGYSTTEVGDIKGSDAEGDNGVTDAYEKADKLGANRFGVAWGGGTYRLKASLQIYDNDNNDLGVLWSTPDATVTSQLVGKIGGKIYFTSAFEKVGSVSVITESGEKVETTDEGNGLYSFTMPSEAVTISTTEQEEPEETVINYTSTTAQSDRYVLFFDGVGNGGYSGIGKVSILINGEEKSLDFINWGNETALLLPFDVCPNDASKLNEITIKSCVIGGFVIKNDINLWISGYKYLTEAPKTVTLTRDGGDYQGGNLNRYVVYFNEIAGGDLAYLGKLSVIVDDKTEKEEAFYQWNNGKSALLLDAENYPLKTEFKITTKTGWLGNYFIADSVTFYIYNEQIIDKTPVTISCGNDVKSEDIVWSEVALTGMFSAKNIEKNGVKVIGYRYENALYESLSAVYGAIGETAPKSVSIDVVTVTIENVYGASIRLASDYQGLRFTVSISAEKAGEITDYGVFATSEAFLKKLGGDFTAIEDGKNGYKISSADVDFKTITEGDSEIYSVVIDVSPANYNKNFVACGYLTVTYAGGTAKTVLAAYSSEANLRSSYEVATKALENSSEYNERQLKIIREYVDGVLDIDENYNLVGAERSYTIEKIADGQVKIVGKDGFDVASVKAFSIKGVRYSATFDSGTVTFDSKLLAAGALENAIKDAGREGREAEILSYYGPSLGIHLESGKLTTNSYACSTVEDVKKYFDAGFNFLVADEADTEAYRYERIDYGSGMGAKDDAKRMLDLVALYCDVYGITEKSQAPVVLYDSFIWAIMDKDEYASLGKTDEQIKNILAVHFETYCDYVPEYPAGYIYKTNATPLNCFAGFTLRDEPYGEDLECYNKWYNYLACDMRLIDNGYVLVGAVISPGVNGQYMVGHESTDYTVVTDETYYNDYLKYIVENMKNNSLDNGKQYLMSDCYPFLTTLGKKALSSAVTSTYKMSSHYFSMMAMYANAARDNGFKAGVCIQSVTHYKAADYKAVMGGWSVKAAECNLTGRIDKDGNLTMNENHIRYQAYMALAYGMERIDYFTYWQHYNQTATETMKESAVVWEYDEATGTYKGVYLPMYDYIKATNLEVKKLDNVVLAFDYAGTRLAAGQTATAGVFDDAASYLGDSIANGAAAAYDLAIGCFTLGSEYKGYMLVNADDPSNGRSNATEMNFGSEYGHAICYINGTPVMKTLTEGKLSFTLGAGDGVFVVPVA